MTQICKSSDSQGESSDGYEMLTIKKKNKPKKTTKETSKPTHPQPKQTNKIKQKENQIQNLILTWFC